jgi:uncharacterized protein YjbJ (UPF0337 family)
MNNEVLQDQWKLIRGRARALWGKLTDDDLERTAGNVDVLAGLLQDKYGYTRPRAVKDIEMHLTGFEASSKNKTGPSPAK